MATAVTELKAKPGTRIFLSAVLVLFVVAPVIQLKCVSHIVPSKWSDLYSPWIGTEAAFRGENPYSTAVIREIQTGFYGRVLRPNDRWDPQSFVYPAHAILLLWPFTFLPWPVVRLLFVASGPPLIALSLWLWIDICGLRLSRFRMIAIFVLVLASWPCVWGFQQQQPSIVVFALLSLGAFRFHRKADISSGILLALSTIKPNLVFLLALWMIGIAIWQRRWRFGVSFGTTLACLIGCSEIIVPGWMSHWIIAGIQYTHDPLRESALAHLFGEKLGMLATAALFVAIIVRLRNTRFSHTAALLLAASACVVPATMWMVYNNILLIPAVLVLIDARPSGASAAILQKISAVFIGWTFIVVPICAFLYLLMGYQQILALLPFPEFPLPVFLTMFLLSFSDSRIPLTRRILNHGLTYRENSARRELGSVEPKLAATPPPVRL